MKIKTILLFCVLPYALLCKGQTVERDSAMVRIIYNEVLQNGACYQNLHSLCKGVGHRLSGSIQAAKAVKWGEMVLTDLGVDTVYLQEIMVPRWERGDIQRLDFSNKNNKLYGANCLAYGGSVATNGPIRGGVVEINDWSEMEVLGEKQIKGKFVFYNKPMNPTLVSTFHAYGGCIDLRYRGALEASKYGAIGVLVRSLSLKMDANPHTGSMSYQDAETKLPTVAISTKDAYNLSKMLEEDPLTEVRMMLNCKSFPDTLSHNVIAEIKGSEFPNEVIVVGGHLDSWDIGEGAHDDGAGIVQSIEVLRLFKELGIKPKHTIRCILFMNEENGNRGGITYADLVKKTNEKHVLALETDRGGFAPQGFTIDGTESQLAFFKLFEPVLRPYEIFYIDKGYGGVDIGPLKEQNVCLVGLVPNSQRYFDYHHAASDVFENVNQRELELGAGGMAAFIYLFDKYCDANLFK